VTAPGGLIDYRALRDKGWLIGGRIDDKDAAGNVKMAQFLLGRGNVVMFAQQAKGFAGCKVSVRLSKDADQAEIRRQIAVRYGLEPFSKFNGDADFKAKVLKEGLSDPDSRYLLSADDRITFDINKSTLSISVFPQFGLPTKPVSPPIDPKPTQGSIVAADACLANVGPRSYNPAGLAAAGFPEAPTQVKQPGTEMRVFRSPTTSTFILVTIPENTKRHHCRVFIDGDAAALAAVEFKLAAHLSAQLSPEPDGPLIYKVPGGDYLLMVQRRTTKSGLLLELHFLRFDPADKP